MNALEDVEGIKEGEIQQWAPFLHFRLTYGRHSLGVRVHKTDYTC